ncbi:MAG: hypothetical protein ACKO5L_00035 [Bacteroidota bacterium]
MNTPNHDNIEYWLFDWVEGNLSSEQEEQLQLFLLLNPEYEADAEAWKSSKINFPVTEELQESLVAISRTKGTTSERKNHLLWWFGKVAIPSMIFLFWTPFTNFGKQDKLAASNNPSSISSKKQTSTLLSSRFGGSRLDGTQLILNKPNTKVTNTSNESQFLSLSQPLKEEFSTRTQKQALLQLSKIHIPRSTLLTNPSIFELPLVDNLTLVTDNEVKKERSKKSWDWTLNKSSALSKFLKKEQVAATQKDRIYVAQEVSHLDINEGFSGNSSQTKVQSTTFIRGMMSGQSKISQQISIDGYSRNAKSGFGLVANYSDFNHNTIREWNVRMIYAPKIALSRYITLEPSVSFSFGQKQLNAEKAVNQSTFTYNSMLLQKFNYDVNLPVGKSLYYRDVNAGVLLNLGPIYLGAQIENLLQHQDNIHTNDFSVIERAKHHATFVAGTDFSAQKGQIRFSPQVIHEFTNENNRTQMGGSFQFKNLVVGGNYGLDKSYTALFGFHGENASILYQATKSNNLATQQNYYLHQITLRISSKVSRKSRRYISL